jgi:hypothetical protein
VGGTIGACGVEAERNGGSAKPAAEEAQYSMFFQVSAIPLADIEVADVDGVPQII